MDCIHSTTNAIVDIFNIKTSTRVIKNVSTGALEKTI